ncbi:MAG TPA: hypothetical protein VFC31_06125 [Candidatus Limnocylindria bacterium]|nr:hypothetical protein [Candidatus Limnocylindria bacterium]
MDDRRLDPRASALSFVVTCALATAAATGLFVLLDPRAQAFWAAWLGELVGAIQAPFGGR